MHSIMCPDYISECEAAASYMGYWNIPFIPEGCASLEPRNKTRYPTLIGLSPSRGKMPPIFVKFFK